MNTLWKKEKKEGKRSVLGTIMEWSEKKCTVLEDFTLMAFYNWWKWSVQQGR